MGDAENTLPPSKKRVAGRQLSKDNPESDDDAPESEMGTFQKASEEVMATRRIVKVRRSNQPPPDASNPFAGIRLVPTTDSSANILNNTNQPQGSGDATAEQNDTDESSKKTAEGNGAETVASGNELKETEENTMKTDNLTEEGSPDKTDIGVKEGEVAEKSQPVDASKETLADGENADSKHIKEPSDKDKEETEKDIEEKSKKEEKENDEKDTTIPAAPLSSFGQLSGNQNAFTGLAGTGFSTSFGFGSFSSEGSAFGATSGPLFSFGTSSATNGSSSSVMLSTSSDPTKSTKLSMQEVPVETGEENERAIFTADAVVYEYLEGGWKERGKGELKLNVSLSGAEKARLIMRAKGNYRLILNASLYPDMTLTNMDKRGITFACVNTAGEAKDGLSTFALKFRDSSIVEEFRVTVAAHKGKKDPLEAQDDLTKESAD